MTKLAKNWGKEDLDIGLDWVLMERQLTSPFRPLEFGLDLKNQSNPILLHSKDVWKLAHKKCQISHLSQYYTSTWNNHFVKIGEKKPLFWDFGLKVAYILLNDLFMVNSCLMII